ncbi:unnamed protein product [Caenorhabditis auriculariae]|uniref:Globin family profile domain-containing protein n=1 Tax=Caenorhabditis auriculariae TaxID=2777116 RepID=A0A8S1HNV6_9PELO|nr:unnamed protein product [Caenorhabditis auriculariae]
MEVSKMPRYTGPVSAANFPHLTIILCAAGLLFAAWFMVLEVTSNKYNRSILKELTIASLAALFLGFGTTFLLLWRRRDWYFCGGAFRCVYGQINLEDSCETHEGVTDGGRRLQPRLLRYFLDAYAHHAAICPPEHDRFFLTDAGRTKNPEPLNPTACGKSHDECRVLDISWDRRAKMMGAGRTGFRYKKHTPINNNKKSKKTNSPSSSQTLSSKSVTRLAVPETMRRRSGSVPVIKLNTLASEWSLKYEHVRALKMTWARLCEPPRFNCKGIVGLVERVWEKLDHKDKDVRTIFYNAAFVDSMHERCERRFEDEQVTPQCCVYRRSGSIATLRDHTHFFVSLVSQVVMSLDIDPTRILEHLDMLGRNHAYLRKYGFKATHWEKVGEYFVDIVVIQDCVRGFPEACRAWTMLIAAMVDRLRAAPRRGSFADTNGFANSRRGSACSLVNHGSSDGSLATASPSSSQTKMPGGCKEFVEKEKGIESRRNSLILPATTIDMSHLKSVLPDNDVAA